MGARPGALACLILAALLCAPSLPAQTSGTASLRGRVMDEGGEGMPGVLVRLATPSAPAGALSVMTDLEGMYGFLSLPPARDYTLTASVPGYAKVEAGPIELKAGRETRLNLTLKSSEELQETVKVEARGETVDTASTSVSTSLSSEFIEGLPLVGRTFEDLLTLAPGVTDADGDGNVNVRGSRDTGLQLRVDGTNVTNPLTGHTGQGVNLESIEELEIVTAGAGAEYGRADGGFANIITKSGGNDLSGSFKFFYRSEYLDNNGAGGQDDETIPFTDYNAYGTLGGAIVKDHLWYFVAVERFDEELPVTFEDRSTSLRSLDGMHNFAKLTWQASRENKLTLQVNHDPYETLGNYIGPTIAPETDYRFTSEGTLPQLTWTAILSPSLLMQVVLSHLDARLELDPVSPFHPVETNLRLNTDRTLSALMPCRSVNCDLDGLRRLTESTELEDGAYNSQSGVDLTRTTFKADFSYTLEDWLGQHAIKAGFLNEVETYEEELFINPVVTDATCVYPEPGCDIPAPPIYRDGTISLQVYDPLRSDLTADSFNVGGYVQDSWKIRPNLTLNLGARLDHEAVTTWGYTPFDPAAEAREVSAIYDILCEAAGATCKRTPGRTPTQFPNTLLIESGSPAEQFDVDGDGRIELNGTERNVVTDPYTLPSERETESYTIGNTNLSPRLSLSWDPWADGRTKVYGTFGRYHDRLFLGAVVTDQKPTSYTATWELFPNFDGQVQPDERSSDARRAITILQTDHDLSTPYTDELTAGFERELAPEWSVAVTYIRRKGNDMLQDADVNHITCEGFGETYGIDPYDVCGDGGQLEMDRFGSQVFGCGPNGCGYSNRPNDAPDLYNLNPYYNQILRVGNYNQSEYRAWELALRKRLHRNWQMQATYTWSRAEGDAESFSSVQGNDPAVSDKVSGLLDYDQTHIFKFQAVSYLPHDILVGGTVLWASGLPYTFISNIEDFDDQGLLTPQRIFSITGEKNDQRNESQLTIDGRLEKRFRAGKTQMAAFLAVENLLNRDELVLRQVDRDQRTIVDGERRFGRRFEIGASVLF